MTSHATTSRPSEPPVVWVTGSGARRVGRFVAEHFGRQGYRLALHAQRSLDDANAAALQFRASGTDCMVTQGDVSDMHAMQEATERIIGTYGRLDVVVHCAAVWDWQSLESVSSEDVRRQFEINTLGSFAVARCAGLQMVTQATGGAIVLLGDWAVVRPYRDFSAYFVGKGAIETLVRSMAVELACRNPAIRVNGILPGPVLLDEAIDSRRAERIREACLLKKHGRPEHVATAAYFLATHEFVTGVCLPVDGGRTIWSGHETDRIAHPTFLSDEEDGVV
jgi:NAD(P)-dependent dehydrogenase (short-subunit alcohol dehydrogenase family)